MVSLLLMVVERMISVNPGLNFNCFGSCISTAQFNFYKIKVVLTQNVLVEKYVQLQMQVAKSFKIEYLS